MTKTVWLLCVVVLMAGCGTDLGTCNEPGGLIATDSRYRELGDLNGDGRLSRDEYEWPGQNALNSSCAGSRCHSAKATGVARGGAPAGLDFDVPTKVTLASSVSLFAVGLANVRDHAGEIWDEIDEGLMPPDAPISDREVLRNWLACGAPARLPVVEPPPEANFESVYAGLSGCTAACHNDSAALGGFSLGADKCVAYNRLVNQPSAAGLCAGRTYVVPENPDASLLLQKMTATVNCGAPMPLNAANAFMDDLPTYYEATRKWIMYGAPRPVDCN